MLYKLAVYCISDKGLIRKNNEDCAAQLLEEGFFVLADGMGGHLAGEVAAKEATNNLCNVFKRKLGSSAPNLLTTKQFIAEAIQEVNNLIYQMSQKSRQFKGMGTTLCCFFLHPEGLIYGHVGDSRIYRFREKKLQRLTQDHSLVRELIELGELKEHEAKNCVYKHIITKAIGSEPSVEPTIQNEPIQIGDIILMCTDGLTDLLSDEEIENIMKQNKEETISTNLVHLAKLKGGYDNVTVVIVKIQE